MNQDRYWNTENFCPAPWTELYVASDGRADNCCISQNNLGNLTDQPVESIIHGPISIGVRSQMLANQPVDGCSTCLKSPASKTLRHEYLDWFQHTDQEHFESENNFKLKFLDLRWKNTCNSACVYCGPHDSSLWASELKIQTAVNHQRIDNMQRLIESRAHEIEYLYLAGGEPLLIRENEWLLDKIWQATPDCEVRVNTNLNSIDNPVFEKLIKFKNVKWIISGESVGDKYEYVRYGSNWQKFINNLTSLRRSFPKHAYIFHMVYCALTMDTFIEYIDFLKNNNLFNEGIDGLSIYYVSGGSGNMLDPRNLPESIAKHYLTMLDSFLAELKIKKPQSIFLEYLPHIKTILESPYDKKDTNSLYKFLDALDRRRNLDSRKIFPELYRDF